MITKKRVRSIALVAFVFVGPVVYMSIQRQGKEKVERRIRNSSEYKQAKSDFETGNFDVAFSALNRILLKHPEQDWLRVDIGDKYDDIKEYRKALDHYLAVRSPRDLGIGERQVLLRVGGMYADLGKVDSAIYFYNRILQAETEPSKFIGYDNTRLGALSRLGQIAFKNQEYEEAVSYLSKATEIKRIPKVLYIRANAYFLLNELDLAQRDYDASIGMIRKIYINKHPYYADILCDTCGTFFGREEYMAVLEEWRSFDQKMKEEAQLDSLVQSKIGFKKIRKRLSKWENELDSLEALGDAVSIRKMEAIEDSIHNFSRSSVTFNIYD